LTSRVQYFHTFDLTELGGALFRSAGLRPADAGIVANDLVRANLRGVDSHGVARIPMYLERLRKRLITPQPELSVVHVAGAVSLVDGDNGMGFLVAHRAMDEAIRLAGNTGIGLVGVRRSTHFGMGALYALQAIEAGYISMIFTNSSPAMPMWGGRTAFLGASPIAAGIPGGNGSPYVMDMAMTVIARGKIRLAAARGEPISPGLALDNHGQPTTDAAKAFEGVCLPFGGVKGSVLATLMDLMAGGLTGANFAGDVKSLYFDHSGPQDVGHLFFAIKPDLFVSLEVFKARMDTFCDRIKSLPRAVDVPEILMPGEPEQRKEEERKKTGIPLTADVVSDLRIEADRTDIGFPEGFDAPLGGAL
jgi:L-2-hydroxycarboxylate dehydrogenase (NAD+)